MVFESVTVTWDDIQDIDTVKSEFYCADCKEIYEPKYDPQKQCWNCEGTNIRRRGKYYIKAIIPFDEVAY